jgi:5-methyltetrahydrofolate--homocysteine methyltransferase
MIHMEDVVKLVKQRALSTKVIVGGAVLTESYANSIGADGYAADAVSAVRLATKLISQRNV